MYIGIKFALCNTGVRTCCVDHTAITLHKQKIKKCTTISKDDYFKIY